MRPQADLPLYSAVMQRRSLSAMSALVLLAVTWTPSARAADLHNVLTDYSISSWMKKDGLPPGDIWALVQDKKGYLWLGGDGGVLRFDGVRFVAASAIGVAGLPRLPAHALLASRDGSLWVGFGGAGGISRIHDGRVVNYESAGTLISDEVTAIVEDRDGTVLAASSGRLLRFTGDRWTEWQLPLTHPVRTAYVGPTGDLFVVTDTAILRRIGADRFETVSEPGAPGQKVVQDGRGGSWITDPFAGFRSIGGRGDDLEPPRHGKGVSLFRDRRGNLWVGTFGQGLWRVQIDDNPGGPHIDIATDQTGLANNAILSLLEDRDGNIWVGTPNGLSRLTPHKFTHMSELGLVTGVETTPDGHVWAATADGVAEILSGERRVLKRHLSGSAIRAMHADSHNTLWIATDRGVVRLRSGPGQARISPVTPIVRAVAAITSDHHGGVWMFDHERGLVRWHDGHLEARALPPRLPQSTVETMLTDSNGRLWIGSRQGVVVMIDATGTAHTFDAPDGLDVGTCRAFYQDSTGTIWVVGNRALARFKDGRFVTLPQENWYPATLTTLVEDARGDLWFGAAWGLVRIHRGELDRDIKARWDRVSASLFDTADGVPGTTRWGGQRSAVRTSDGLLWFVTARGLTIVDPGVLRPTRETAPIELEEVSVNNQPVTPRAQTALPAGMKRLEIGYTLAELSSTLKTRFRYRLDGLDSDWVDADTHRQAIYTNLRPGSYVFRVEASAGDGDWVAPGATWDFSVAPAFYQRLWFYGLIFAGLVAVIWSVSWLRAAEVRRQFALLLSERVRLSREIHDTLLQSLVGVSLQLDHLGNRLGTAADRDQLTRMRKQIDGYVREARQSIWNLRSSMLQQSDLTTALRQSGERATESAIQFDFTITGTPHRCASALEEQVLRVGQEAMTNAVRHSHAQSIHMQLDYGEHTLRLRIADDGCGFEPPELGNGHAKQSRLNAHWGLLSMKERAETVDGTLRLSSAVGAGTVIELTVPMASS